jgi:hypothetical protein
VITKKGNTYTEGLDHVESEMRKTKMQLNAGAINILNKINTANDIWDVGVQMNNIANGRQVDISALPLPYGIDVFLSAANDIQDANERSFMNDMFRLGYKDFSNFLYNSSVGRRYSNNMFFVYVSKDVMLQVVKQGYFCMNEHSWGRKGVDYSNPTDNKGNKYDYMLVFPIPSLDKYNNKISQFGALQIK